MQYTFCSEFRIHVQCICNIFFKFNIDFVVFGSFCMIVVSKTCHSDKAIAVRYNTGGCNSIKTIIVCYGTWDHLALCHLESKLISAFGHFSIVFEVD